MDNDVLGNWKSRMEMAYDNWKVDFDKYAAAMSNGLQQGVWQDAENASHELQVWITANRAVYHAAHVILFSNFLDIQIYAGARHILGRSVTRADHCRSQGVVKRWANKEKASATKAIWHAAQLIKDASSNLRDFDAGGWFIHPWCLYLATITIWSFYHAQQKSEAIENDEDEMIWDAKAAMAELIEDLTDGSPDHLVASPPNRFKTQTTGLTAVIAKHLSKIRWAIVHDGMLVLRGLVPWRLIVQDHTV